MEEKKYCTAAFLDVEKAFDKVWQRSASKTSRNSIKRPISNTRIIHNKYYFYVRIKNEKSSLKKIHAGVPQDGVLGPILYALFTADLPGPGTKIYTFADDTAILSTQKSIRKATKTLQNHLNEIEKWTKNNKIKINTTKCVHLTFTLNKGPISKIKFNNQELSQALLSSISAYI